MNATARPKQLIASLERRGYRVTRPRRKVARTVEEMPEGFTAESLCDRVSGVGRATVYRTLRLLLDTGAVCKLPMPDGTPVYKLAPVEHHHHTVCVRCGAIGEFGDSTVERIVRSIGREISGEIVGHRMEFHIICSTCLAVPDELRVVAAPGRLR